MSIWFLDISKNKEVKQKLDKHYNDYEEHKKKGFLLIEGDFWFIAKYKTKSTPNKNFFRHCYIPGRPISYLFTSEDDSLSYAYEDEGIADIEKYINKEEFSKEFDILHIEKKLDVKDLAMATLPQHFSESSGESERIRNIIETLEKELILKKVFENRKGDF